MYGGHIVNDFDRLLCVTYLEHFLKDELLDEMELFPFAKDEKGVSFKSPSPTTADRYVEHIDLELRGDTPIAFGLHPNTEIGFRTEQSETLLRTLLELQPRDSSGGESDAASPRVIASGAMQEFLDAFGETVWDTDEVQAGLEDVGPFQNVLILELKQMNTLLSESESRRRLPAWCAAGSRATPPAPRARSPPLARHARARLRGQADHVRAHGAPRARALPRPRARHVGKARVAVHARAAELEVQPDVARQP